MRRRRREAEEKGKLWVALPFHFGGEGERDAGRQEDPPERERSFLSPQMGTQQFLRTAPSPPPPAEDQFF